MAVQDQRFAVAAAFEDAAYIWACAKIRPIRAKTRMLTHLLNIRIPKIYFGTHFLKTVSNILLDVFFLSERAGKPHHLTGELCQLVPRLIDDTANCLLCIQIVFHSAFLYLLHGYIRNLLVGCLGNDIAYQEGSNQNGEAYIQLAIETGNDPGNTHNDADDH